MRRHRVAAAAALLLTASVTAGVISTTYQARRAQRRFQDVRHLANEFVFGVYDRIQDLPGSTEARKAIVATALQYLESLRREDGNDAALQRELAAAYYRIGDVQGNPGASNLGDSQGALTSYRSALSILQPLARRGDFDAKLALTAALYKLAILQRVLGDRSSNEQLQRAQEMARTLMADRPSDFATLKLAADIASDRTRLATDQHAPQQALEAAQETAKIAQRMLTLNAKSPETLDFVAQSETNLGMAYKSTGDPERSAQTFRAALDLRERLVREHPDNTGYRRLLLLEYGHLGDALGPPEAYGLGQLEDSVAAFEKAAEIAEWLSSRDPADRKSWFDAAVAELRVAASQLAAPDEAAEALQHLRKAETILARLIEEDPSNQRFRMYQFIVDVHAGKALAALGRDNESMRRSERALISAERFRGGPYEKNTQAWASGASLRLAQLKAKRGDPGARHLADSVAAYFSAAHPGALGPPWMEAMLFAKLGSLYLKTGSKESATPWLEKSEAIWRKMAPPRSLLAQRDKALAEVKHDLAKSRSAG